MKRVNIFIVIALLYSCSSENSDGDGKLTDVSKNELTVTQEGDSIENGQWNFTNPMTNVSKSGLYKNGQQVDQWKYTYSDDTQIIQWGAFKNQKVDLRYPKYLIVSKSIEPPILYQADIPDDDNYTYVALLEYNLKSLNVNVNDYLYQINQAIENDTIEILKAKKFRKYYFDNFVLFTANIQIERNGIQYNIISHVFERNGFLYDLSYKNISTAISVMDYEVFGDILYSLSFNNIKLFTYSKGQYQRVEDVVFD